MIKMLLMIDFDDFAVNIDEFTVFYDDLPLIFNYIYGTYTYWYIS
jgi:hypothetical protein